HQRGDLRQHLAQCPCGSDHAESECAGGVGTHPEQSPRKRSRLPLSGGRGVAWGLEAVATRNGFGPRGRSVFIIEDFGGTVDERHSPANWWQKTPRALHNG